MTDAARKSKASLAGFKVRQWRKSQTPKVTLEDIATPFGYTGAHWARFELGQTDPNLRVMMALANKGIASLEDWTKPAPAEAL